MTEQPCLPGECSFSRSTDTNEPVGRCFDCGSTVEQAEARWEDAESQPVAFADVPASEVEAYLASLDAESVRESR